jgi:hypothetical protein
LKELDVQDDDWKLLTLSIGANDVVCVKVTARLQIFKLIIFVPYSVITA